MIDIESIVKLLQKNKQIPLGIHTYTCQVQPASLVYKVEIGEYVLFIKKIKPRFTSSVSDNLQKQIGNEYIALKKFHTLFSKYPNFNVPRPLYSSTDDLILVTESVRGTSIIDICDKYGSRLKKAEKSKGINICRQFGEMLKVYHDSESYPHETQDVDRTEIYVRERLMTGVFNGHETQIIGKYLEKLCTEIKDSITKYYKHPIHSDVSPNNVFYFDGEISLLDFADQRTDHIYYDLISFKLMLDTQLANRLKYRKTASLELAKAFSAGYGFEYEKISQDKMHHLCLLKILSIFITTYALREKEPFHYTSAKSLVWNLKDKMINYLDYFSLKKAILNFVRENNL